MRGRVEHERPSFLTGATRFIVLQFIEIQVSGFQRRKCPEKKKKKFKEFAKTNTWLK